MEAKRASMAATRVGSTLGSCQPLYNRARLLTDVPLICSSRLITVDLHFVSILGARKQWADYLEHDLAHVGVTASCGHLTERLDRMLPVRLILALCFANCDLSEEVSISCYQSSSFHSAHLGDGCFHVRSIGIERLTTFNEFDKCKQHRFFTIPCLTTERLLNRRP